MMQMFRAFSTGGFIMIWLATPAADDISSPITFNKGPHAHVNMCGFPIKVEITFGGSNSFGDFGIPAITKTAQIKTPCPKH